MLLHYSIQSSKPESLVYGRHLLKSASVCFCPKMPRNYVHCLPPSPPCLPLNVQLTLRGRKVNISKVPNYMQLETCTSQKAFEACSGVGLTTKSTKFCAVLPRNITCTHKKEMIKRKNISLGVLCTCGKKTPITEEARKYNIVV